MGESRRLWIEGPAGRIECSLRVASPPRAAAVFAHPHPLFGGTLHNPVIFHSDRDLHRNGWTTLRFNFRGVGASEGVHDDGRGEVDDVGAAASWLRGVAPDADLVLVGYSFGAWCALRSAVSDRAVSAVVAIGLPARLYDFSVVSQLRRPLAVVQGTQDEFGDASEVAAVLDLARPAGRLFAVADSGHLFPGRTHEAAQLVVEAAESCLGDRRREG